MAQSSKKQAEEAVLDLKGKLRQLNKALAGKGATITENAPLVATIKAVEGMKEQAVTMSIFKRQQFFGYVDESLPPMRISDGYKPALIDYCFAQNMALKSLPSIENVGVAVNLSSFASACGSLIEVSLGELTNATDISSAFSSCPSLTSASIGAAPKVTNASYLFSGCSNLKDVSIDLSGGQLTNFSLAFFSCSSLRRVTGTIDLSNANMSTAPFQGCSSLEEVRIKGLKVDLDLSTCVNLSVESVKYLVDNLQKATGKTISLASDWQTAHTAEAREYAQKAAAKGFALTFR
jgi:bacterial surface protein 26-residue repeat protein